MSDVFTEITNLIGRNSFIYKSSSTHLKIQTEKPEDYRTLIRFLKENDAEFHTYQFQSEKPYRVIIRNIYPTTSVFEISSEFEEISFATRQVTNIRHNLTKNPLPLFFADLELDSSNQDFFKVTSLLHTKINVEEPPNAGKSPSV